MVEEPTKAEQGLASETTQEGQTGQTEGWKEVATQLQALGGALASALKTAWTSEENKRHLRQVRSAIEAMVGELGAAIKETATSPQAQQLKEEAEKTLETVKTAGEKTVQEITPKLASTLAAANEELRKVIARMKKEEEEAAKTAQETESSEAAQEDQSAQ